MVFNTLKADDASSWKDAIGIGGRSFTQIKESSGDKKFAKAFNAIIKKGDIDNFDAISEALKQTGLSADQVSQSMLSAAENSDGASISIKAVGKAAKASSVGMKLLAAAGNMLTTLAASLIVTGLIKGIELIATTRQRATEAAQEAQESYKKEASTLESLNTQLEDTQALMKDLEGRELTLIEEDEYNRLKDTNDQLEREIELQKERVRIAEKDARQKAVKDDKYNTGNGLFAESYTNPNLVSAALQVPGFDATKYGTTNDALEQMPGTYFQGSDYFQLNADMLPVFKQQQLEAEAKYLDAYDKAMADETINEAELKNLEALQESSKRLGDMYDEAYKVIDDRVLEIDALIGDLERVENASTPTDKAFNALFDERDMLKDIQNTTIDATAQFASDTVLQKFADDADKIKKIVQSLGEISQDQLTANFGNIVAEFEKFGWTIEDVARHLNELYAAGDKPKSSASSLYSSLFKSTEAYTKLTEAMNEQNEAGALSFETYTALIEANSEFAELLELTAEGYVLNSEAVWEYVEAQDEFNKLKAMVELEKINEQLLNSADLSKDEVDALMAQKAGWEQIIISITNATGALQQWKQAQASANQDAAFNEGKTMYDTIKEGLKTGKVGTDDFQESVDFMLGDDWEQNVGEGKTFTTKDAAYKAAQQKAKRYYGQEDERVGMQNFMQDLVNNGFAEYNGEDFKLLEDVNLEGIAEGLGMSVDAIKSMFGLMQTYGADIQYAVDTSELTEEDRKRVENANSIEEIRKAQAEVTAEIEHQQSILNDTSATEAQKQAAQEEINNLNTANEVLEEKKGILEGVEGAAQALTLDEALSKITELQTAINTLTAAGIDVPVEITGQYTDLTTLISQLGGQAVGENGEVQGFVMHVSGAEEAEAKIKTIQELMATIQANPNIGANIKAQLIGASAVAVDKLREVVNNDQKDVTITLIAEDQATTDIDGVVTGPEGGWNATINVKANKDQAEADIDNVANKERIAYIKIVPDSTVDLGEGETIESKVEGTGFAATKQDNGSYKWTDPISYFNGVVSKLATETGKTPSQDSVMAQYEQDVANGLVAFGEATHSATELISSALQIFTENAWADGPDGGVTEGGVEGGAITIDEVAVDSAAAEEATETVQSEFDKTPIETDVEVEAGNIQETIEESTPGGVGVEVKPEVKNMSPEEIQAALEAGELPINTSLNTVTAEAQNATLHSSIETPASTPVSLDTAAADSQHSSLVSRLTQSVTKTVQVVYSGIRNSFATGTKNAPEGLSLVDDGTGSNAGPELIVHNKQGTYELGSGDSPRVTHLDKGDTVYTAKQTKAILAKAAKVGGFFRNGLNNAKAWIGNAFATGVSGSMSWKKINSVLSGSGSSKKNSSSSSKASNWSKYAEQLFDWIEIRLERLQVQTEKWMLAASEAIGFISKNNELDKALTSTSQQIEETTQAYQQYIEQANIIAQKTKLSADIITKIQNGAIDIASYNGDTQKKIQEYQEWWDKAEGCVEALTELREQERELATQKLDSILDHYQWRIDRLDAVVSSNDAMLGLKAATGIRIEESDYAKSIEATTQKIQELADSRAALADEFADMVERGYIVEGSELWYEYTGELENLDETIIETKTDLQDLIDSANNITLTNLQYAMDALENSAATMEQMMSLHEAQGSDHSDTDYEGLIKNGMAQIKNLEAQNAELLKQQAVLEPLSEKYQELQEQIDGNNQSILDLKTSQEQWNDAVIDLKIGELEKYKEQLSKTNDEYQRQKELQQAIEDLERAKSQRTQRVFRDGVGFVFEADQDAVLDAQRNLEDVIQNQLLSKLDDLIEALDDTKADTNVYDAFGVLLGKEYSLPDIGNYSELLSNFSKNTDIVTSAMEDAKKAAYEQVLKGVTNQNSQMSFQIGDIVIQNAKGPEDLANAILDNFPNAILQAMHSKT